MTTSISSLISPTKARRDAAEAKDWAYVSSWMAKKYHPQPVPRFERDSDTLNGLLELAAVNEAADREVELMHRAEEEELSRYETAHRANEGPCQDIFRGIEKSLDEQGAGALGGLAEASLLLGTVSSDAILIGERIMELSHDKFELEDQLRRISNLQAQLERQMESLEMGISNIQCQMDEGRQEEIQQRTAQLNRETKQFTAKAAEYNDRLAGMERFSVASPSLPQVREQEQRVNKLQAQVKSFERQIAGFHGLPPDLEAARGEYQRAQGELLKLKYERDEIFESIIRK